MNNDSKNDLRELKEKINNIKEGLDNKNTNKAEEKRYGVKATKMALSAALELFSGILVGGLIGYMLDYYLGTKFIFLLIFCTLGLVAGVINLYRNMINKNY